MEGKCNLECWCHVPTRGQNKPPCYVCVLQTCSSCKSEITPSAPPLSPVEFLLLQQEEEATLSYKNPEVALGLVGSDEISYGWRAKFTSSEDPLVVDLNTSPDLDNNNSHPSSETAEVEGYLSREAFSETPEAFVRRSPAKSEQFQDVSQEESVKENSEPTKGDLSELIKSLVLGNDDILQDSATNRLNSFDRWNSLDSLSQRRESWQHENNPRLRGTRKDHYQTPSTGSALLSVSHDMLHVRSHKYSNSVMTERHYKSINRIHRRETSAEAAVRYKLMLSTESRRS
ncbi:hypothetical protein OTU49_006358 [Cherax quadricarinatus]|uniref:Uncharacterized protein n=1 Tax=Cherax quadricarinatus TaxID=27406 RepID=A0AAW0WMY7_CHEQU